MKCPSMTLFMAFVLKSILSDINIATIAFFRWTFTWNIFQPFTFCVCRCFVLWWVSCRQHMCWSCFLIHSATLCLLIGAFNPFTLKAIIDRYLFIFSPLYLCSSISHSFSSSSYTIPFSISCSAGLVGEFSLFQPSFVWENPYFTCHFNLEPPW